MLGLAFLLFSALTIVAYVYWLILTARTYKFLERKSLPAPVNAILSILLGLAPLHRALVYPLIKNECSSNGGIIFHSEADIPPRDILVNGYFYNIASRYPISELFSSEGIDSVTIEGNSHYGEGDDIKSKGQIYDPNSYTFIRSDSSDISCGPYYGVFSESILAAPPLSSIGNCIAISKRKLPANYLKISALKEEKTPVSTGFHTLKWDVTKIEAVASGKTSLISELRNFHYDGLRFPLFFGPISIGGFSCKADTDAQKLLLETLHLKAGTATDEKEYANFSREKVKELTRKYWSLDIPEKLLKYSIKIWDHDSVSSPASPLSVRLIIPKQPLPLSVSFMSNTAVKWRIEAADEQLVLAEMFSPEIGTTISGVAKNQTWGLSNSEIKKDLLLEFYLRAIRDAEKSAMPSGRYCGISHRATKVETIIKINSCSVEIVN